MYKDARKQLQDFEDFARINNVIPLTTQMAKSASIIQADLRKKGTVIGHTDTLIAGIATTGGFTLVTNNTRHFARIEGLKLENWTI